MSSRYSRGERICVVTKTLARRGNENTELARGKVNLHNEGVGVGETVVIELHNSGRSAPLDSPVEFVTDIHKTSESLNIPKSVIDEQNLLAGQTVDVYVFEAIKKSSEDEQTNFNDGVSEWSIVGSAPAISDPDNSDGLDSKLNARGLSNTLNGPTVVKFRNIKNGKESIGETKPISKDRISFPAQSRKDIEASTGDRIQILRKGQKENNGKAIADGDESAMLREIYRMLSEIHDAQTND